MYTPRPFAEHYLPEQVGHRVYYARYGNPDGPTIITCHGGPGSKSKPKHAASFDLEHYHVVCFDQRGCGQSEPAGEIANNTTQDLVADMERIRTELGIETWYVAGSSWGSTLALAYAEAHPERVRGLLLSAIFLADKWGDDWAFFGSEGTAHLFPDGRALLLESLGALHISENSNIAAALYEKFENGSDGDRRQIVALFSNWDYNLLAPHLDKKFTEPEEVDESDFSNTRIFLHYLANQYFLSDNQILQQIASIKHIPACIVHGRIDILCPLEAAWQLHQALPQSTFVPLPESAHVIKGDGALARYYAFATFLARKEGKG